MGTWFTGFRARLKKHWFITTFFVALVLFAVMPGNLERFLIYFPTRNLEADPSSINVPFRDLAIETRDGVELHGWFIPHPKAQASLLIFHGNAGNISHRIPWIELLHPLEINIVIIDYRGYGKSGGAPFERGLYMDSDAAYEWWQKYRASTGEKLILLGESLGGAVAADLASRTQVSGLILQSTFTSARDMAKTLFPVGLLQPLTSIRFDTATKIGRVNCPKLIIHGRNDEIVPFRLGRKLFELAPEPKEFLDVPRAGHNDLVWVAGSEYLQRLKNFLNQITDTDKPRENSEMGPKKSAP
jgi:fermentation-respiration switch protein FrsA (DUF1100 family)